MFASWENLSNYWWQWNEKAKTRPSETTPYRDRLSTLITLREEGNMRETGRGSLTKVPHSDPETPHSAININDHHLS